jgi:hypothetical protein
MGECMPKGYSLQSKSMEKHLLHQKKNLPNQYTTTKFTGSAVKKGLSNAELTWIAENTPDEEERLRLLGNRQQSFLENGERFGVRVYSEFGRPQYEDQFGRQFIIETNTSAASPVGLIRYRMPVGLTHKNNAGFSNNYINHPSALDGRLELKAYRKKNIPSIFIQIVSNLSGNNQACGLAEFQYAG